jgi:hypothetical protein
MKTSAFKTIMALALLLAITLPSKGEYEKKLRRAWPANGVTTLDIENKFGDINLVYTRDDSVVIDILVTIPNLSGRKAEHIADMINFKFSSSNGRVRAETVFSNDFKTNQDFKILYTVNIPDNRDLKIKNQFGNVTFGDLNANGTFDIDYGNIHGKACKAINLELKYGSGSFADIERLKGDIHYSKFSSGNIDIAQFDTRYSVISFDNTKNLIADSRYDSYRFDELETGEIDSKFTNWKIEQLNQDIAIDNEYGDIDIDHVSANFKSIYLDNHYGNIKFGIDEEAVYDLKSEARYCKVHYPKNADTKRYIENNNTITVEAVVGNGIPKSKVFIDTRYGKVDLME